MVKVSRDLLKNNQNTCFIFPSGPTMESPQVTLKKLPTPKLNSYIMPCLFPFFPFLGAKTSRNYLARSKVYLAGETLVGPRKREENCSHICKNGEVATASVLYKKVFLEMSGLSNVRQGNQYTNVQTNNELTYKCNNYKDNNRQSLRE